MIAVSPKWQEKREEIWEAILHDGWLLTDVAEYYGVSVYYAGCIVRQLDIPFSAAKVVPLWCPWPNRSPRAKPKWMWSTKWDRCIDCGTTERKHARHGRCTTCDARWRYAQPAKWIRQQEANRKWQAAHPEQVRASNRQAYRDFQDRKRRGGVCLGRDCWNPATPGPRGGLYCDDCRRKMRERYHASKRQEQTA